MFRELISVLSGEMKYFIHLSEERYKEKNNHFESFIKLTHEDLKSSQDSMEKCLEAKQYFMEKCLEAKQYFMEKCLEAKQDSMDKRLEASQKKYVKILTKRLNSTEKLLDYFISEN